MPDVGRKDGGEAAVHPIRRSSVHSVLPVSDPHVEEADAHHGRRFLKRSRLPAHLLAIHVSRSVQPSDQHFGMLLASLIIVVYVRAKAEARSSAGSPNIAIPARDWCCERRHVGDRGTPDHSSPPAHTLAQYRVGHQVERVAQMKGGICRRPRFLKEERAIFHIGS
jgi:hypothetical protein